MTHELSDKWVVWYHHVNDNNWLEDSYTKLHTMETIENYCEFVNTIPTFTSGMFLFMKDAVFPRWEDINNIDGGYWTFRISKKDLDETWTHLLAALIGNTLTNKIEDMDSINGISISPKINNCIIKIWNNNFNINDASILTNKITNISPTEAYYRKHQDQTDLNKSHSDHKQPASSPVVTQGSPEPEALVKVI